MTGKSLPAAGGDSGISGDPGKSPWNQELGGPTPSGGGFCFIMTRTLKFCFARKFGRNHLWNWTDLKKTICGWIFSTAATAVKSLQSCPTLCDLIDGSPPGCPVPGILQSRTLEWAAISFSKFISINNHFSKNLSLWVGSQRVALLYDLRRMWCISWDKYSK